MAKKRILFVIGSFNAGGAEKSTVNQLNEIDSGRFDVYAYVFKNEGLFASQLPSFVKVLSPDVTIDALMHSPSDWRYFMHHPVLWMKKILRTSYAKLFRGGMDINQMIWKLWTNDIPELNQDFDVAVGQQEGIPNYFATDKVRASNKVLWVHSEYGKLLYDASYDADYFSRAHAVVTISDLCRDSLKSSFPQLDNFQVLPNITSSELVHKLAAEDVGTDCFKEEICNIISIGRLSYPKNFELAIAAAALLKTESFPFRWIIIGEGPDRAKLQRLIDSAGLTEDFILLGLRSNPYNYLAKADVAVQTSLYEGKSIFADEAKMLCKVFVSTPYDTIKDSIADGETGIIAGSMSAEDVADAIVKAYEDKSLRETIITNLCNPALADTKDIDAYYKVYGL